MCQSDIKRIFSNPRILSPKSLAKMGATTSIRGYLSGEFENTPCTWFWGFFRETNGKEGYHNFGTRWSLAKRCSNRCIQMDRIVAVPTPTRWVLWQFFDETDQANDANWHTKPDPRFSPNKFKRTILILRFLLVNFQISPKFWWLSTRYH